MTVSEPLAIAANPLLPSVPSVSKSSVAVPLIAPAALVSIPTVKLELSLELAPSWTSDPLVVAEPVVPPNVALSDSEKPSAAAAFSMVKSC